MTIDLVSKDEARRLREGEPDTGQERKQRLMLVNKEADVEIVFVDRD